MDVAKATSSAFPPYVFEILDIYASNEALALVLLDYCQPKDSNNGIEYANTLLGAIFSVSVLPKVPNGSFEYFQDPLDQV